MKAKDPPMDDLTFGIMAGAISVMLVTILEEKGNNNLQMNFEGHEG